MPDLVRTHEWPATPLGPREGWPVCLSIAADVMLACGFPMAVLWGPERVLIYNDAFRACCGGRLAAGFGRPLREGWPDAPSSLEAVIARAFAGETVTVQDQPLRVARGGAPEDAWFTASCSPIRDETGGVGGALVTLFESAERHRAGAEGHTFGKGQRVREEQARLAVRVTQLGTWRYDPDHAVFHFDARMSAIWGEPPRGAVIPIADVLARIHPDDRARVRAALEDMLDPARENIGNDLGYRIVRPGGEERWVVANGESRFEGEGGFRRAVSATGTLQDVTASKRRERNLAFLSELQGEVALIGSADEIMEVAGARIGAFLNLSLAFLAGTPKGSDAARVHYIWSAAGTPVAPSTLRLSDLWNASHSAAVPAGEAVVLEDTEVAAPRDRAVYRTLGVRSAILVPFERSDDMSFLLAVCDSAPREWRADEVEVCRELPRRIFPNMDRARAEAALRRSNARLEADLRDATRLRRMSMQLIHGEDVDALFEMLLDTAMAVMRADCATLQMLQDDGGELRLLAFRGFKEGVTGLWGRIRADSMTASGRVLRTGERVVVRDVERCAWMAGTDDQALFRANGIRAVQSTPLVSRSGRLLGVLSTHWREPRRPTERDLRLLDILARQAADLIERHQTEEVLRRSHDEALAARRAAEAAQQAAETANRAKAAFLATMSHELRTPLNAIVGYTDLLQARISGPLTEGQEAQLERIKASSRHLLSLIEEILTFSRIEAGRERVRIEAADMAEVVRSTAQIIEPLAAAKGLDFRIRVPDGSPPAQTDFARVRQILLNLLSNAIKFTDRGEVRLEFADENGEIVFRVADTGSGIASKDLELIFDPFSQVEQTNRRTGGTGLGLSVSRQLARLLGGDLTVESTLGGGSTFTVRIPRSATAFPGAESAQTTEPSSLRG